MSSPHYATTRRFVIVSNEEEDTRRSMRRSRITSITRRMGKCTTIRRGGARRGTMRRTRRTTRTTRRTRSEDDDIDEEGEEDDASSPRVWIIGTIGYPTKCFWRSWIDCSAYLGTALLSTKRGRRKAWSIECWVKTYSRRKTSIAREARRRVTLCMRVIEGTFEAFFPTV